MMKKSAFILILMLFYASFHALAQHDDDYVKPDRDAPLIEFAKQDMNTSVDSVFIKRHKVINNYSMLGVQYGVNLTMPSLNPSKQMSMGVLPMEIGLTFTRYCKLFGYMPYFGFQAGILYSQQGYSFDIEKDGGYPVYTIVGAYKASMNTIEIPLNAQFHVDFWKMKLLVNIGCFGGYRLGINREYHPQTVVPEDFKQYQKKFHPSELRYYYGIQGGGGIGFMFDPIEVHITAGYKYNLSSLHKPNVNLRTLVENENMSNYYYSYTNLNSIYISVSINYQLNRRIGKTRKELKQIAREQIMEANENLNSEGR